MPPAFPDKTKLTLCLDLTDCGDKPVASVVSISYHLNPDIHEDDITPVIQRQCTEFGKVRALTISCASSKCI